MTNKSNQLKNLSEEQKKPVGRPAKYSDYIANRVCELIATNTCSLDDLCTDNPDIPSRQTIYRWRWENDLFCYKYAKAKMFQAELLAEELDELSHQKTYYTDSEGNQRVDTGQVAAQRLIVDTRKWIATKLAPRIYGDKTQVDTNIYVRHEDALKELE